MKTASLRSLDTKGFWFKIQHAKDLLVVLIQKELKVRYKSSWLGYVWSIANPLAFASVYYIVFGIFMHVQIPNYPAVLIAGLFPWQWVSNSINASPNVFIDNATLVKKVRFPRNLLVASLVLNDLFHFVVSIPVILIVLLSFGLRPSLTWSIGIPALCLAQAVLVYGLAVVLASLNLFFRDLQHLTNLSVMFLFFLTPIVYSVSMIPNEYQGLVYLNPVCPLILCWKQLFLSGTLDWALLKATYLNALVALAFGTWLYHKLSYKFAEVI